jgi:hypothetical protein
MIVTQSKNWRWEEVEKNDVELTDLAQHFELYNRTEGKSPSTIRWYNLALQQF